MREVTLEELLEAGCHFGHQVTRQNPKARDFVFESRDNIHIIDLAKTKEGLEAAGEFVKSIASKGGNIVVVGTKRQAQTIIADELKRAQEAVTGDHVPHLYTVTTRWMGGTLTNYGEVSKNYKKLQDYSERLKNPEEKAKYTKKEIGMWEKSRHKLSIFYGGISEMKELPQALFIVDTHMEDLAVSEAQKMHVPTIGIVDTNADPSVIDYPIPANDDAVGSLKFIVSYIIDAWIEGAKNPFVSPVEKAKEEKPAKKAKNADAKSVESRITNTSTALSTGKELGTDETKKTSAKKPAKKAAAKKTTKKAEEPKTEAEVSV